MLWGGLLGEGLDRGLGWVVEGSLPGGGVAGEDFHVFEALRGRGMGG